MASQIMTDAAPPGFASGLLASAEVVAQHDRFRDFLLRLPTLPALPLDGEVGLFLGDSEIALKDALRALDDLPCLEPLGQLRVLDFEPRHLDLGADEEADGRDELDVLPAVVVRLTMLQVDDADQLAARQHGHREEGLVAIFGEFVECLEARILEGVAAHGHRLAMLGDPPGNPLSDSYLQAIDDVRMRRLRRA